MAMVRVKSLKNGRCRRGSRHRSGKKGCWRNGKR
jgi:hypothetical protein